MTRRAIAFPPPSALPSLPALRSPLAVLASLLLAGFGTAQAASSRLPLAPGQRIDLRQGTEPAAAASAATRDPSLLRQELERMRQEHARGKALEERLVDLRIRHSLGFRIDADTYFARSDAERARGAADAERLLSDERQRLLVLQQRCSDLQQRVDQRRSEPVLRPADLDAASPAAAPFSAGDAVEMPIVRSDAARGNAPLVPASPHLETAAPAGGAGSSDTPAAGDGGTAAAASAAAGQPAKPAILIHGSRDHSAVGRALFDAGEYEKARDELLLLGGDGRTMAAVDLFYLARCHEQLGDRGAADSAFAQVEALDTKEGPDGKMVPGSWAQAARISRKQMNWTAEQGGWRPSRPIESIQWRRRP